MIHEVINAGLTPFLLQFGAEIPGILRKAQFHLSDSVTKNSPPSNVAYSINEIHHRSPGF
jgi:hypothetical protein